MTRSADLIEFALEIGGLAEANGYYRDDRGHRRGEHGVRGPQRRRGQASAGVRAGIRRASNPDAAIRSRLERLATRLHNFGADIAQRRRARTSGLYEPTAYFVSLSPVQDAAINPVRGWPWPDLHPSDFLTQPEHGRQLTPEEVALVTDNPLGAPNDLLIAGPDTGAYLVRIRALLPDEVVPTH